jgi:WD40 repeat protein
MLRVDVNLESAGCLGVDRSGAVAAIGCSRGIALINLARPFAPRVELHRESRWPIESLAWSPRARAVIAATSHATLLVWDTEHAASSGSTSSGSIHHAMCGPDSSPLRGLSWCAGQPDLLAAGSSSGSTFLWDLRAPDATKRALCSDAVAGVGVVAVQWNPLNDHLVATLHAHRVGGIDAAAVRIWDLRAVRGIGGGGSGGGALGGGGGGGGGGMGSSLAVTPRRAAPPSRGLLFRTASGAGRTPARRAASRAYQRERGPLCLVGLAPSRSPATAIAWSSARSNIITTASADPGGTVGLWDISAASAELSLDKGGGGDATAFARCVGLFETGAPVRAMRHSPLGDGIVTVAAEGESARSVRLWATPDSRGPFSDGADAGGAVQVQGPTAATQLSSGARVAADVGDLRREWAGHDTRVVAFDWRVRGEPDVQLV